MKNINIYTYNKTYTNIYTYINNVYSRNTKIAFFQGTRGQNVFWRFLPTDHGKNGNFKNSIFQNFKNSKFQKSKISKIQFFKNSKIQNFYFSKIKNGGRGHA